MYKTVRNKVTSALRKAKTSHYHHLCSSKIHPSQLWKHLNTLLSRKKDSTLQSLVVNDRELSDKSEIAETMNSHFIRAAPLSSASTNPIQKTVTAAEFHTLSPVTEDGISTIVLALDPKKSSGPSDINAKCLQLTLPSISSSITRILNLSLCTGSVPSCWKAANVTPVFMKGDKLNPSNYRPISVISALGKILERVVYTRLMCHLSENNILTPYQSGFRPNHSTEYVLLLTVEDRRQEVDQGKAVAAVSNDFSKAFDSISHPLLLKKLQVSVLTTWL